MNRLLSLFFALLLVRTAVAAPVPDGFLFEKNDHFLTPSESLSFSPTGSWTKVTTARTARTAVDFRIVDLAGTGGLRRVSPRGFEQPGLPGRLPAADAGAGFRTAQARLAHACGPHCRQPANGRMTYFRMKFYVRSGKFAHRVVYLLDSVTPEGFAFWINGRRQPDRAAPRFPGTGQAGLRRGLKLHAPLPESKF